MEFSDGDSKQKMLEYIILIILKVSPTQKVSSLHIQKEIFLLIKFHPDIKNFYNFIKHYKGPFSRDVEESIRNPFYLENCWTYLPPKKTDKLSGGHVSITPKGSEIYESFIDNVKAINDVELKDSLFHILSGIDIVTTIYGDLSNEELLLLIYKAFPTYVEKSNLYYQLDNKKDILAHQLFEKGRISKEKCESLSRGQ